MMFEENEAFQFVENKLKVPSPRSRVSTDRKAFLEDIVVAMQTQFVFNNLRLLSVDHADRRRPTIEEIKKDLLNGYGGLCYSLNLSTFYLLQAMGFKVAMVHGSCTSTVIFENNHLLIYVSDVEKPGDKFIMEVALGYPTFRIVSFDFEAESPAYQDSFIEYKYMKHNGKLLRMHRKGNNVNTPPDHPCTLIIDGWRRFYYADLEGTTDISDFDEPFEQVYTNPKATPFLLNLRIIGFPSRRATMIINDKTLIENDQGDLVPSPIEGGDEGILQTVHKHFPVFPESFIRQAIVNWRKDSPVKI